MNDLIYLNVGGYKYTTTRATLCKYPDSMLGIMFALDSKFNPTLDKEGNVFIDANGRIFEYILDYLKHNTIPQDSENFRQFQCEMNYFQIPLIVEKTRLLPDNFDNLIKRNKLERLIQTVEFRCNFSNFGNFRDNKFSKELNGFEKGDYQIIYNRFMNLGYKVHIYNNSEIDARKLL